MNSLIFTKILVVRAVNGAYISIMSNIFVYGERVCLKNKYIIDMSNSSCRAKTYLKLVIEVRRPSRPITLKVGKESLEENLL